MGMSLVLADVVIAHVALRVLICFNTFISVVILMCRGGQSIALKPTVVEDVFTFYFGLFFSWVLLPQLLDSEGVINTNYEPTLLPEGEAQNQGNGLVLDGSRYQDNTLDQDNLLVQVSSPNHDSLLFPELPPFQEDLGNSALHDGRLHHDDPRFRDDVSYPDDPLIQGTAPYKDNIESEQDRRNTRNSIARIRRRISHVPFIRDPGRRVDKSYLVACAVILVLDSLCLWLWIESATWFPWDKHRWELKLENMRDIRPGGTTIIWPNNTSTFVPDGSMRNTTVWSPERIHNWSAWWWPAIMLEIVNLLIFLSIYIADWTLLVYPLALRWRGVRSNARNRQPKGRRVIIASQTEITPLCQDDESPSNELR